MLVPAVSASTVTATTIATITPVISRVCRLNGETATWAR